MSEELESTNSTLSVRTRELTNAHSLKLHVRSNTCRVDLDPEACNTFMTKELKPAVKGHAEHGVFWQQIVDDRISLLTEEETCEGGATDKEWLSFLD